jgi:His/Glu/Gln/Arg/opine family amino acid ABC transporter permease subunit
MSLSLARESLTTLLAGLVITVELTLIVIVISLLAGIPVALARMSKRRLVRAPVTAYVELFRATPLLLQLIYIYYALPLAGIRFPPFLAAVVGLSLNYTAYLSEVYRSGIQAVPKGQWDAAAALGMPGRTGFIRIVLPQAVRTVIPALGNYGVALFKDTSLASVITLQELLFSGQIIAARSFDYFTIYTVVFVMYLIVGYIAILGVRWLERRAARGYRGRREEIPLWRRLTVWKAGAP